VPPDWCPATRWRWLSRKGGVTGIAVWVDKMCREKCRRRTIMVEMKGSKPKSPSSPTEMKQKKRQDNDDPMYVLVSTYVTTYRRTEDGPRWKKTKKTHDTSRRALVSLTSIHYFFVMPEPYQRLDSANDSRHNKRYFDVSYSSKELILTKIRSGK
jgi:hypothetical protein